MLHFELSTVPTCRLLITSGHDSGEKCQHSTDKRDHDKDHKTQLATLAAFLLGGIL